MSAGFFYLSFVDESLPRGQQFVGATIVDALDAEGALAEAVAMGLVPQGVQVALVELYTQDEANQRITNPDMLPSVSRSLLGRLATRAEIEASGSKPLRKESIDAFVCKDHANP